MSLSTILPAEREKKFKDVLSQTKQVFSRFVFQDKTYNQPITKAEALAEYVNSASVTFTLDKDGNLYLH